MPTMSDSGTITPTQMFLPVASIARKPHHQVSTSWRIENASPELTDLGQPKMGLKKLPFDPLEYIEHLDQLPFDPGMDPGLGQ